MIRFSDELDPGDGVKIDISPGALGDNALGTNNGDGHDENPVTGSPYERNVVLRGDFTRVLAQFWADGPASETPPGHWNTIANEVSDSPGVELRIGGEGRELDRLEWDVKLYFALNGAVHDAAVAAWGVKGRYDSVRPISMIRYMGNKGQSSDPDGPSFDPAGLPLVPGRVEVVTERSSRQAGRTRSSRTTWVNRDPCLAGQPRGPGDVDQRSRLDLLDGVGPVPAGDVRTPAFAGYVSGHSTFSRAAAEVMTAFTGSAYFPGGLSEWTVPADSLAVDLGPSEDVTLQWATYYDAADQAGISRLFGGIHIPPDDFEGRKIGAICGKDAWALAQHYFDGTAVA